MTNPYPTLTCEERFWTYVRCPLDGSRCWEWVGGRTGAGYGRWYAYGRTWVAHRHSYEITNGPISDGMQIDHLCRNKWCVNPYHLESVTAAVNSRRAGPFMANARKICCPQGHAFEPPRESGWSKLGERRLVRICLTCRAHQRRARYERQLSKIEEKAS